MGPLAPPRAFDPTRSFEAAWKLLKQAPGTVMVGGLLLFFFEGGATGGLRLLYGLSGDDLDLRRVLQELRPWLLLLVPLCGCVALALFVLASWIEVGFARAVELALRTGRDDVGMLFAGGNRLGPMLLARFFTYLIGLGCSLPIAAVVFALTMFSAHGSLSVVLVAGGLVFALVWMCVAVYLGLGLVLVNPIVALENCSPTEAIARSWKLAEGQRWRLLWFSIFQLCMAIAGLCLCCIGLLLTVPLIHVMRVEIYVALTRGGEYPHWWIGSGRFPFDGHTSEDFSSPSAPPPVPPPLPPQS